MSEQKNIDIETYNMDLWNSYLSNFQLVYQLDYIYIQKIYEKEDKKSINCIHCNLFIEENGKTYKYTLISYYNCEDNMPLSHIIDTFDVDNDIATQKETYQLIHCLFSSLTLLKHLPIVKSGIEFLERTTDSIVNKFEISIGFYHDLKIDWIQTSVNLKKKFVLSNYIDRIYNSLTFEECQSLLELFFFQRYLNTDIFNYSECRDNVSGYLANYQDKRDNYITLFQLTKF